MRVSAIGLLTGSIAAPAVTALPGPHGDAARGLLASPQSSGFNTPIFYMSKGGQAACVSGYVPVTASTNDNINLDISLPKNQSQVTEFFSASYSAGSTVAKDINKGKANVFGTWNIFATLCTPKGNPKPNGVQLLTHGVGFDNSYWDFAEGYSYVDVAAKYGYASFSYDRLGVGKSEKPDPVKTVQAPLEVEIAHSLASSLREGTFGDVKFEKVIGVGHSFGSIISNAITKQYPSALDAAILTGYSTDLSSQPLFLQALNLALANANQPLRFGALNNGFLVSDTVVSNQIGFFKAPGFPPANLKLAEATKGTVTYGELNSIGAVGGASPNFTNPVAVVNGINDIPFCGGNCSYPVDQAKAVQPKYYPNVAEADFGSYLAPVAGHGLNFHYSATAAFEYIQKFLVEHKLGMQ
jgi:pimeloyl-ACP methyl ester carboxylesterase